MQKINLSDDDFIKEESPVRNNTKPSGSTGKTESTGITRRRSGGSGNGGGSGRPPRGGGSGSGGGHRKNEKSVPIRVLKWILRILLILIALCIIALIVVYVRTRPLYADARKQVYEILSEMNDGTFKRESNTLVYDTNDKLLSKIGYENYKYTTIDKVSKYIQEGYIDVEDKHFLSHHGVDYARTFKAAVLYLKNKISGSNAITQGGSTITQQVVKNNLLTQEQTVERKFLEILLARQIEKEFSKSQIMEYYVNSCYYGNGCYGVEGASQYYFGVSAADLDLAQAAILVGTSNSPNTNNPVADYELAMEKKTMVLGEMLEEGDITQEEYDTANEERPEIVQKTDKSDPDNYMVSFAIHDAALKLMEYENFEFKYSFESEDEYDEYVKSYEKAYAKADSKLRSGGYEIHTSFDQSVQKKLQSSINDTLSGEKDKTDDGQYSLQAAGVVIDNSSGMIIAAVGGRGKDNSYNRAYQAQRQPGSAIKPLLVYGPAIDKGVVTPGTTMTDKAITINGYSPKNVSGTYMGSVTVRGALARSLNTIAVQIFDETGSQTALSYLDAMKFSTLTFGDSYNTAIALGGFTNGCTVEDMARGYATLENDGKMRDNTCIKSITQETGDTLYTHSDEETQIYSSDTAFMMQDMMQGVFKEDYGTAHSALNDDQVYCGKTGTTDNNKDAWFAGFSKYYTTVTWVGCDTPQEIDGLSGDGYPLSIWSDFMDEMHKDKEKEEFTAPETVKLKRGTQEKDVTYTEDVYDSRPSGWDYISQTLTETIAENEAERQEEANYKAAKEAVEEFEDFQIESAQDAKDLDTKYNEVMDLVDEVGDTEHHADLAERAEYKYSLLSGEVRDNWLEELDQLESQEQEEENLQNAQEADDSSSKAVQKIKEIRIAIVNSYIDYFNNVTVYTDTVVDMIAQADAALEACTEYDEYDDLSEKMNKAIEKASSQMTEDEVEQKKQEAESESKAAAESIQNAEEQDASVSSDASSLNSSSGSSSSN